jgi:hypothetical protein
MAFSKIERKSIEDVLTAYCEKRVPPQVRDILRILFRIKGESVTLLESRPSFVNPTEWIETVVAQFRRDQETGNWHVYEELQPKKTIKPLLSEVDRDPTGIFWG